MNLNVNEYNSDEIGRWMEHLRSRCGVQIHRLRKNQHTDYPSIQGSWTPFTNLPTELNVTQFPKEELSQAVRREPTATELVLEMAKQQESSSAAEKE